MAVATQLVAQISVQGASQAQSTFNSLGNASDVLGRKLSSIKPFQAGNSIAGTDVARARLNQLEVQVQAARDKLQTLQGAGNVGESIRNLNTAQNRLKLLESDVEKARQKLYKLQDAADAGRSVTGIPEAEAKLAILSNKAAEAREKVAKLQNAADASQSVKGIPEAQARLQVLEARAAQAKDKLTQIEAGGREANSGFSLVSSAAQRVNVTLQSMVSAASEAGSTLSSKLSEGLHNVGGGLISFIQSAGSTIFSLKQIGQTALQAAQGLLAPNIQAENARVSFQAFIKDGGLLNKTLQQLSTFAAKTSFQFPDIQNASLKFLNMGVSANQLQGYLTKVGDAVAKVNGDGFMLNDVVTILSQMSMKGKVTTEEMQQLSERNIPAFRLLAQSMHVSEAALQDMISRGEVGKDKIDLLVKAMGQWGNGAMQAQGKTFSGLWSTVTDSINLALGAMTGPLFDLAKQGLQKLVDTLGSKQFTDFTDKVSKGLGDALGFIGKVAGDTVGGIQKFLGELDKPSVQNFLRGAKSLGDQLSLVFGIINGIGKQAFAILSDHLSKLGTPAEQASGIIGRLGNVLSDASKYVHDFANFLSGLHFGEAFDDLLSGAENLGKEFGPSLQKISGLLAGDFGRQLKDIGQVAQEFGRFFKKDVAPALKDAEPGFTSLAHAVLDMAPPLMKIRGYIMDVVEHGFKVFGPIVERIVPPLIRFAGVVAKDLADGLKFITPYIVDAAKAVADFAKDIADRVAPIVTQWLDNLKKGIDAFSKIWAVVWPGISQILSGVWDEIVGVVKIAWALVSGIIKIGLDLLSGNWKQAWEDFKAMLAGVWDGIKTYLGGVWKIIGGIFTTAWAAIQAIWGGVGAWFQAKWGEISKVFANVGGWFHDRWSEAWKGVTGFFGGIGKWFQDRWNDVVTTANNMKGKIGDALQAPFRAARDNIGGILKGFANNMIDRLNGGIHGAVDFINKFADAINGVAGTLGAGAPIGKIKFEGIPHYATGTDSHPGGPAIVGEEGPEMVLLPRGTKVLPNKPTEQLLKSMSLSSVPAYASGVGDIGSQVFEWIAGGAKSVIEGMMRAANIHTPHLPGKLNDLGGAILSHVKDWAISWVSKILPDFSAGGNDGGGTFGTPASGDLKKWILQAMALTHAPANWLNALTTIAQYESGGNPSAVNNYDINAQRGDPSRGLFQTIMSTFMAYALPGHTNIFAPVDNAAAAIGYIRSRYGSVFNVPGIVALSQGKPYVGYRNGGWLTEPIVGMGLRTGTPYSFVEDGKPEYVSPAGYMPAGTSAIASGGAGSGGVTHVHIHTTAELNIDGARLARMQMPEIVQQIRAVTGARI